MKRTSAELKRAAREDLNGHWGTIIGANVLSSLIIYGVIVMFYMLLLAAIVTRSVIGIAAVTIIMIGCMLAAAILSAGIVSMHLRLARRQEISVGMLFSQFTNRSFRYILSSLLLSVMGMACMLPGSIVMMVAENADTRILLALGILLYILGMVVYAVLGLKFGLVNMLLIDNGDMGVIAAYRESDRKMYGNKGRIFYLFLTFIGWSVLGSLSCGIGMLWVMPYMSQTSVEFYLEVKGEREQTEL